MLYVDSTDEATATGEATAIMYSCPQANCLGTFESEELLNVHIDTCTEQGRPMQLKTGIS